VITLAVWQSKTAACGLAIPAILDCEAASGGLFSIENCFKGFHINGLWFSIKKNPTSSPHAPPMRYNGFRFGSVFAELKQRRLIFGCPPLRSDRPLANL
jgi:hypothetical protein